MNRELCALNDVKNNYDKFVGKYYRQTKQKGQNVDWGKQISFFTKQPNIKCEQNEKKTGMVARHQRQVECTLCLDK